MPHDVPPEVLSTATETAWRVAVSYGELIPDGAEQLMSASGLTAHMALNKAQVGTVVYRVASAIYEAGVAAGRAQAAALDSACHPAPCRCLDTRAAVAPTHTGHCCFLPSTQGCHPDEVAAWVARRNPANPSLPETQEGSG